MIQTHQSLLFICNITLSRQSPITTTLKLFYNFKICIKPTGSENVVKCKICSIMFWPLQIQYIIIIHLYKKEVVLLIFRENEPIRLNANIMMGIDYTL